VELLRLRSCTLLAAAVAGGRPLRVQPLSQRAWENEATARWKGAERPPPLVVGRTARHAGSE
jgi:hypothetical protein